MAWNGQVSQASWNPKTNTGTNNKITSNYDYLNVNHLSTGTITAESIVSFSSIQTQNLSAYNSYLPYLSNINILTNLVTLDGQGLTATTGGLFLNGNLIGTPSTISSIHDWARFPAVTNVEMAQSTIKNALGISSLYLSTSLIKCDTVRAIGGQIDTLFGFDQINYPKGKIDVLSNLLLNNSTINTDTIYSKTINNEFEISTFSVYATQVNANTINNTTFNGNLINGTTARLTNQLVCRGISTLNISTGTLGAGGITSYQLSNRDLLWTGTLYAPNAVISTLAVQYVASIDTLAVNKIGAISTLKANNISTTTINTSNLYACNVSINNLTLNSINATNGYFNDLYTNNFTASNNTTLNNLTANGSLTFNNDLAMNGNVNFPTNNSEFYGAQYIKDINNLRNLNVEKITILGGWTGDDVIPPYYNDSILEIGEDILRPAQVTLNGFNPDPLDTGIALTVRGDTQITQNLNVLGLVSVEGDVNITGGTQIQGELNVVGLGTFEADIDVAGLATFEGAVNVAGGLAVEGETNLAGAVTCEAGIGIVGALGLTAGDVTFGSAVNTGNTFTVYYNTNIQNSLNVNNDLTVGGAFTANNINIITGNVSTINTFTINLGSNRPISPPYTAWDSNTIYDSGDLAYYNSINYVAASKNRNNPPPDSIPFWYPSTPYDEGNVVRVAGVGDYVCILSYGGSPTPPNSDFVHWIPSSSVLWNFVSYTQNSNISHIQGDSQSYISIGNVSTINCFTESFSSIIANISTLTVSTIINQQMASFKIYNSSITTQEIILENSNNAFLTIKDTNGNDLGYLGKPEFQDNIVALASACNLSLQSLGQTTLQGLGGVGIQSDLGLSVDAYAMFNRDAKFESNVIYNDLFTTCNYPTYVGGQIQHWNPVGGYYDFYYSQLYYTDEANAAQDGVDGYSNHRAIAQDWSYYKCENLNLDMNSNFIVNCGGLFINQLVIPQASSQANGYTGTGIIFGQESGDSEFWQIVKPIITGTSPQGSEGVYITTRSTANGAMTNLGRLYDNNIYTPWANVTADLSMNLFSVLFKDQTTAVDYGINFNNNFLQYTQIGAGSHYVAQDWSYFAAERNVDLNSYSITSVSNVLLKNVNFTSPTGANCNLYFADSNLYFGTNRVQFQQTINYPTLVAKQTSNNFSRTSNTAEVQVFQSTMNLKVNTQYQINMSYSGLQQNILATPPNSNWYFITRIHSGSNDLSTNNLLSAPSIFNSTQLGSGTTTSFTTTSSGQITSRWYLRNQSLNANLNISNLNVSFYELP